MRASGVSARTARPPALRILEEADARLAGWSCANSTDCCRFAETGREPQLSRPEWQLITAELARTGRRLPPAPASGNCPFLSRAGRCDIYAVRPLGCRTYFCRRAEGPGRTPPGRRELGDCVQALADEDRTTGGDGSSRPLSTWLASARRQRGR
jgi:Fe-S-cluster containining protein